MNAKAFTHKEINTAMKTKIAYLNTNSYKAELKLYTDVFLEMTSVSSGAQTLSNHNYRPQTYIHKNGNKTQKEIDRWKKEWERKQWNSLNRKLQEKKRLTKSNRMRICTNAALWFWLKPKTLKDLPSPSIKGIGSVGSAPKGKLKSKFQD